MKSPTTPRTSAALALALASVGLLGAVAAGAAHAPGGSAPAAASTARVVVADSGWGRFVAVGAQGRAPAPGDSGWGRAGA
ncbi:hypothetical protein ACFVFQ_22160 [Streptomyces sp. NPDC057743]|uniref:hypothetical protein n=1 Tax=Streptomyces sp. NPDC057743 TaxID=3346236 RepID=UPI0036A634F7